ncbi:MAG TPA: hypothetical protein VF017_08065 [Thermoanaerobaculia bacterium]|nr:hypothetical protein [Thermoanaerobaculia bacterium]
MKGQQGDLREARKLADEVLGELEKSLGWNRRVGLRVAASQDEPGEEVAFVDLPAGSEYQWLKVGVAASGLHEVQVKGAPQEVLVLDSKDAVKARGQASGQDPLAFTVEEPGSYFLRLKQGGDDPTEEILDEGDAVPQVPTTTQVAVVRPLALAPAMEKSDATLAQVGESYRARVERETVQWAGFEAKKGHFYTAETSRLGAGCDTRLSVYGEADALIGTDDDGGEELFSSRVKWYAREDGSFWLEVSEVSSAACTFSIRVDGEAVEGTAVVPSAERGAAPSLESSGGTVLVTAGFEPVYVRLPAQPGRAYWIESSLDFKVEAPAFQLWDRNQAAGSGGGAPAVTSGAWAQLEDGDFYLQFQPSDDSGIAAVRVADAGEIELPEEFALSPLGAKPRAVRPLPPRLSATVAIEAGQVLVAKLKLAKGDSAVVGAQALARDLTVTVGRLEETKRMEPEAADEDFDAFVEDLAPQTEWLLLPDADGEVFIQFSNTSEVTGRFLLEVEVEKPYSGFKVGDRVILGQHRPIQGRTNWNPDMRNYVGKPATITRLVDWTEPINGVEGVYLVRVKEDEEGYVWRTRDLRRAAPEPEAEEEPAAETPKPEPEAPPVEP